MPLSAAAMANFSAAAAPLLCRKRAEWRRCGRSEFLVRTEIDRIGSSYRSALHDEPDDLVVFFGRDDDESETLLECAQSQIADLSRAAFKRPALAAVVHDEADEIAKAVEHHLADLAGKLLDVLLAGPANGFAGRAITAKRRRNSGCIAAQAVDPSGDLPDVANEHRIPAVGLGHRLQARLQNGQGGFLGRQHRLASGDRDLYLERTDDVLFVGDPLDGHRGASRHPCRNAGHGHVGLAARRAPPRASDLKRRRRRWRRWGAAHTPADPSYHDVELLAGLHGLRQIDREQTRETGARALRNGHIGHT